MEEVESSGLVRGRVDALISVLAARVPGATSRILVVGCGSGEEAGLLARALGAETIGIDLGNQFAFDPAKAAPAVLMQMDAQALTFGDGEFDLVYSFHALEHIADPVRALREMRRVLKPGGRYIIGTPNKTRLLGYLRSGAPILDRIRWNAQDWWMRLKGQWRNEAGAHAGFTAEELTRLCAGSFGEGSDVSGSYYLALYSRRRRMVRTLLDSGLWRWAFPAVYVAGIRR